MHKRNKKNKQKHPNPTPPQQKKNETKKDEEENKEDGLNLEVVAEAEENIHNSKEESMPEKIIIEETIIEEIATTPIKPKRNKFAKNNKSRGKKDSNDKADEEIKDDADNKEEKIKDDADNKEEKIITKELLQEQPKSDDEISNMKLFDIKDKDEKIESQESIIPTVRKKKVKQNKDKTPTDKTVDAVYEEQCQNIVTPVSEKKSADVNVKQVEESHFSGIDCTNMHGSIEQKSGNKKKNKNKRKQFIEPENTDVGQIEDKLISECVKIEQEKKEICLDQPRAIKHKGQLKLNMTAETVLIPVDQERQIDQEIDVSGTQIENQENKKGKLSAKPQKNRCKNKKKQQDFIDINKNEQPQESKGFINQSTANEENSPISQTKSEIGSNENTEIESKCVTGDLEQNKIAEGSMGNIDRILPIDNSNTRYSENFEYIKESATSTVECVESHESMNFTKESKEVFEYNLMSSQNPKARLILEALPPLPENDSNNLRDDNSDAVNEIVSEDFEKLLSDSPEPVFNIEETTPKAKIKTAVPAKTDLVNYAPLSESNIDASCKKLFEALLVDDATAVKSSIQTIHQPKNEEQFLIRLFDKSVDVNIQTDLNILNIVNQSQPEKTYLKDKVMEVNKNMEDLKLSIEKSLAELTAMECDEMPELVSISDCEPLSTLRTDKEATMIENEEKNPSESISPVTKRSGKNEKLTEDLEITIFETKHTLAKKKNKDKGEHDKSDKNIDYRIAEEPEIIITSQIGQEKENIKGGLPSFEKVKNIEVDLDTTKIQPQCSIPEPKGKGKGKNKKIKDKDGKTDIQLITQTSVQTTSQTEQSLNIQECKDKTKPLETSSDVKGSEQSESKNSQSTEKHTKEKEGDHIESVQFTDAMNCSLEDDVLFERKAAEKFASELTRSCIGPIENDMIVDNSHSIHESEQIEENEVENPMAMQSKNLLGTPDIPVTSSKNDYKKEKNKNLSPNSKNAKIKLKDTECENEIENEKKKCSKYSQTEKKLKKRSSKSTSPESENEEFVYQYSFRKVFLTNCCNICNTELKEQRYACGYCNLIFYCSQKHKDEEWPQHQALCFAVSTLVHLKGLKFLYGDAAGCNGQDYRLLRMQVIVSCEKILKRKLLPCEQEALLYPRMCAEPKCREWKSALLKDCEGCGLAAYCTSNPEHITREHQVWCKSYRLYHKLVTHQQCQGRLEPKMPSKVISEKSFRIPNKMNELLALIYEEKIDMDDVHYAALTQLATAPLTAVYSYQLFEDSSADLELQNGHQEKTFVLHIVGAELQFEADTLNKWEVFFLHIRPDIHALRIVFVGPELNPTKLPLGLLAKIKICKQCRLDRRKIIFDYQDGQLYHNYVASRQFVIPDIVCAFNPGLHRKTGFGGLDSWPQTINSIIKLKIPFCVTSYTKFELPQDMARINECTDQEFKSILGPTLNPFASIRPDRNFISDDEMPLIFKNYCVMVLCGV